MYFFNIFKFSIWLKKNFKDLLLIWIIFVEIKTQSSAHQPFSGKAFNISKFPRKQVYKCQKKSLKKKFVSRKPK